MVRNTSDNSKMVNAMVKENKYGQITHFMKVIGQMIKLMERAGLSMQKVMPMKVIGKMIKLMAKVHTIMLMDKNIRVDGMMILSMGMVKRNGQMELSIKGIFELIKQLQKR
jgi:hypothetical protein